MKKRGPRAIRVSRSRSAEEVHLPSNDSAATESSSAEVELSEAAQPQQAAPAPPRHLVRLWPQAGRQESQQAGQVDVGEAQQGHNQKGKQSTRSRKRRGDAREGAYLQPAAAEELAHHVVRVDGRFGCGGKSIGGRAVRWSCQLRSWGRSDVQNPAT